VQQRNGTDRRKPKTTSADGDGGREETKDVPCGAGSGTEREEIVMFQAAGARPTRML